MKLETLFCTAKSVIAHGRCVAPDQALLQAWHQIDPIDETSDKFHLKPYCSARFLITTYTFQNKNMQLGSTICTSANSDARCVLQ
jgi:hypothetical protein